MIGRAAIVSLALLALALPVPAQEEIADPAARARAAGNAARPNIGSEIFSGGSVAEVVTPYAGTDIPETGIDSGNIEARRNEAVAGGTMAARGFQDILDSATLRPEYDPGPDHVGITVADEATIRAEDIAGRYFSSSTSTDPACEFDGFGVLEPFERFCETHTSLREQSCMLSRVVDVDREDSWRCDVTRGNVTVTCRPGEDGACAPEDLPESQPSNQCRLLEERCIAHEPTLTREPASGGIFDIFGRGIFWIGYGLSWEGVRYETRSDQLSFTAPDGWTYYRACTGETGCFAVWREREMPGGGRCLEFERDYACTTGDQCASLSANAACERTETRCLTRGEGGCELERATWVCRNDLSDHAPAERLESRIERIEDRLVNSCDPPPSEQGCVAEEAVCTSGPAVRTVMGFPVSRECWEYRQDHSCLAGDLDSRSDCGPFQADQSCEVIGQTCLSEVEAEEDLGEAPAGCQHWEYRYRCGGGIDLPEHCTAFNVCVGSLCEGIVDEPNTDFGNAAAWLTMLDEAAKDSEKSIDMQRVSLFAGAARNCRIGALSTINCCNDSGWANGILGECSENELALMDRVAAKAAIYVGTYCSRRVLGVCLQRRRSYCTFNSQLAMVFQKEIRRLAGTDWGSARSPNCTGLRLDEMERIDWDRIDLSEAFEDMMNEANVPTSEMVTDYLRDRLDLTAGAISGEGGP
ncbi:conjugal transfer protein TraN [Paracoccus sp. FO-3]|uniref:conjugal transfer protein TraN n=1 Tax=Paracoccus sp. FO-3 TaxID=1335059 RepID=UPI00112A800C|nr:conjugal transfer protein TraN [Paracoccus sp. FO-3]